MPSYKEAMQFAVDKEYPKALGKLNESVQEIEKTIGNHTKYHLLLYQRIASICEVMRDDKGVEEIFLKSVETASKLYPK